MSKFLNSEGLSHVISEFLTRLNSKADADKTISAKTVSTLPQRGENNILYLVPDSSGQNNSFNGYMWINNTWKHISAETATHTHTPSDIGAATAAQGAKADSAHIAGIYDENGVLLAPWSTLGFDVETSYSSTEVFQWPVLRNYPSARKLVLPFGIKKIGSYAFYQCRAITDIVLPESVTVIENLAFSGCTALERINIPPGVTSIGGGAFYRCTSLAGINLPDSVTSIGWDVFNGCTSLTGITIPESVTSVSDGVFSGCTALTICCEAASLPDTWDSRWNPDNRPVIWNYKPVYYSKGYSNPNLLDNWYFADPINQRGGTEYIGAIYGVDRWIGVNSGISVALNEGYTTIRMSGTSVTRGIYQTLPNKYLSGKEVTFSVLTYERELLTATTTFSTEYTTFPDPKAQLNSTWNVYFTNRANKVGTGIMILNSGANPVLNIVAMKLELGNVQTLARFENGSWVLNDPPPAKGAELAKCRYYYRQSTQDISAELAFSGEMRIPNPTKKSISGGYEYSADL